jgi:predicted RND superfamily exporter protein
VIRRLGWRGAAALLVAVVALALVGGGLARLRVETGVASFLPTADPAAHELDRLARSFGGDPVVVLVESRQPRALLGPEQLPRLLRLEGRLAELPDVAVVYGPATTLNQIAIQTQNLLAEISGRRDGLRAAAEAKARRNGASPARVRAAGDEAVTGFERRYGGLLVRSLPAGLPTLRNPSFVTSVVYNQAQQPKPQWRHVVPSERSVAILVRPRQGLDQRGTERLVRGVRDLLASAELDSRRVTVTGAPVVAAALGGQIRRELPLLGAAALVAVAGCLLAAPWTRRRRHRVLPLVVMLAVTALTLAFFGWRGTPISLGVVGFLPVLLGVGSYYPVYLLQRAHRREVLVVAGAAAAAFASLVVSPPPFVRDLGTALAVGITFAVGAGLVLARVVHLDPPAEAAVRASASHARSAMGARRFAVAAVVLAALSAAGWGGAAPAVPGDAPGAAGCGLACSRRRSARGAGPRLVR